MTSAQNDSLIYLLGNRGVIAPAKAYAITLASGALLVYRRGVYGSWKITVLEPDGSIRAGGQMGPNTTWDEILENARRASDFQQYQEYPSYGDGTESADGN